MSAVFQAYSAYYDLLYRDKDYAGEAQYVQSLLQRHRIPGQSILELGCGTGRHATHLARAGYLVLGIDQSDEMVRRARSAIPQQLQSKLSFQLGDVRDAKVSQLFDAAVSLFHVVSYQSRNEDLMGMFATASNHLRPGGLFLFDFWYGPAVLTDPPSVRLKRLEDSSVQVSRIAEPSIFPNQNIVDVHYTVFVKNMATAETTQLEETHRMRYLFLPELEMMLRASGMRIATAERWMAGELDLTSWQAVIVARKE